MVTGRDDASDDGDPVTGGEPGNLAAHPLAGRAGVVGRVVTAFDPDGYVLVDGLLVRALPAAGRPSVGDEVELGLDRAGTLRARAFGLGRTAR